MDYLTATWNDLHFAASYISELLSDYVCHEAGFSSGIPHAFAGGWQVTAMGGDVGDENIICITPASNNHLRRALAAQMQFSSSYEHACLYSPGIEATYHSFLHRPGDIAGTSIELHCHPRNGVPMTVIFHPAPGMTESGKPIRIDMLQAGEYGPRHIHKPSDPPYLMEIAGLPFLSPNEYCRAKLRRWTAYDVPHLCWMIANYSDRLDPNRLPVEEVEDFVDEVDDDRIRSIWEVIKVSWGIYIA